MIWLIAHQSQLRYFEETTQQINRPVAMYIADQIPLFVNGNFDSKALADLAAHMIVINPSVQLYLLDTEGRVIAAAANRTQTTIKDRMIDLAPVKQFLSSNEKTPIYGDDPQTTDRKRVFSAFPLSDTGIGTSGCDPCGYVYAILGGERAGSIWQVLSSSQTLQFATMMLLAVFMSALLAGLCLFFMLTRPLRTMTQSIAQWQIVASGNSLAVSTSGTTGSSNTTGTCTLGTSSSPANTHAKEKKHSTLQSHHRNELEALESTCHEMAQRLTTQYIELDKADRRRRQLFTHLSHDLRTPLTSVCGALEKLINMPNGESADERQNYLNVAYRQACRLDRLIDQVFELARLDSGEVSLELEAVSFQELAMDTVQELEPNATMHGVSLQFLPCVSGQEPLVSGDAGQLNRVLVNLLSNAIKNTPENGSIFVETQIDSNRNLAVSIYDTGCGFETELNNQPLSALASRSRSNTCTSRTGTGLGLSIVSKILALHGSEAIISSSPTKGTQVTFELKLIEQ